MVLRMKDEENFDDEDYKSKTQIKEEMHALKDLGSALLEVPKSVYDSFPIPDELDEAIQTSHRIKSHIAKKRQLQYIGKVMRRIEHEPIQAAYDEWKNGRKKLSREHNKLEELRDQLIEGDQDALNQVINDHPDCDIQQIRQMIRAAQQEKKQEKPPKSYRKLFKYLRELKEI